MSALFGPAFAAIAAILVALISLAATLRSSARQRVNAEQLEELKARLAIESERRQRKLSVLKSSLDNLTEINAVLQNIKDQLLILSDSPYKVVSTREIEHNVGKLYEDFAEMYKKVSSSENGKIIGELHNAKHVIFTISRKVSILTSKQSLDQPMLLNSMREEFRYARKRIDHLQDDIKIQHARTLSSFLDI